MKFLRRLVLLISFVGVVLADARAAMWLSATTFLWCLTQKSENGYEFFQGQVGGEPGWAGRSVVRIPGRA